MPRYSCHAERSEASGEAGASGEAEAAWAPMPRYSCHAERSEASGEAEASRVTRNAPQERPATNR
ncbi:MAG: hypothetical protein ACP5Q1_09555 [Anaerolineae bacterium]